MNRVLFLHQDLRVSCHAVGMQTTPENRWGSRPWHQGATPGHGEYRVEGLLGMRLRWHQLLEGSGPFFPRQNELRLRRLGV